MFTIYRITNTVNQKSYIGFTTQNPPKKRWTAHKAEARRGSKRTLCCSIRKYGSEAHSFDVLAWGENHKAGIEIAEPMLIEIFNPEYNMTFGGEGASGLTRTREQRLAISKRMTGKRYSLGFKHPEKVNLENSIRNIGNKHGLGYKFTKEQSEAQSIRMTGISRPRVTCPKCGVVGGNNTMKRWHFDNCNHQQQV